MIDEAILSVLIFNVSVNGLGHNVIAKVYKIVERLTERRLRFLVRFSKHDFRVNDVLFWLFDWTKAMDQRQSSIIRRFIKEFLQLVISNIFCKTGKLVRSCKL